MRNPLAAHPPWRQLTIIAVLLPLMIVLAVLAFAWPAARIAPRGLPVGVVGTGAASAQVLAGLNRSEPGGFDVRRYPDQAAARAAIRDRDIYGAFVIGPGAARDSGGAAATGPGAARDSGGAAGDGPGGVTVLEASAASPAVAQLLSTVGEELARNAGAAAQAGGATPYAVQVRDVDVVPLPAGDPRGLVLPSALLPLTICGVIMAAVIGLVLAFRPAWRQIMALIVVSATAGLGAYLIAQGFLGALPQHAVATWAVLSLILLAIGSATAGLIALIGAGGLGLSILAMIFVGNPFSGATSAPELLPAPVGAIGQWLPPGAGANLLRSTAYFGGHGAGVHLTVLVVWIAAGLAAIAVGHHTPVRFAARRAAKPAARVRPDPAMRDAAYSDGAYS
ncbi:MAG TPA: ABC transporter permease [Streptosporangiaceae bacterium]|nr:ABC transporter permease [Streptosporangiaceae bacterium]